MQLLETDLNKLATQLAQRVAQAPNFFQNTPLVIDLQGIQDNPESLDFVQLKATLIQHGLLPVGIRHGNEHQEQAALAVGLGSLANAPNPSTQANPEKPKSSKLVTKPVRSGQQIYAPQTDLIVTATVSAGAEILADGNIHVYAPLRGRALAGISGDKSARIFCQQLSAELISIAGIYLTREDITVPAGSHGENLQVYLEDDELKIDSYS